MDSGYAGAALPNAAVRRNIKNRRNYMAFQDLLTDAFNLIIAALVDGLVAKLLSIIGFGA